MSSITQAKRIVVKVGTSSLTYPNGALNIRRVGTLVRVLSDLKNSGREIILVSSGAIAVGVGALGLKERPADIPSKQACAAIGQCELMYTYDKMFSEYRHKVAQVLLTRDCVDMPQRKQNVVNTFERLLEMHVIPVVNENDTVATEEIEFGDNDMLSAIVGNLCGADLLIVLSDIDGLYDKDPHRFADASRIDYVETIDDRIKKLAGGKGTALGTGGMITKINAAEVANSCGFPMVIMNGETPEDIYHFFDGERIGTLFASGNASGQHAWEKGGQK